MKFDQIEKRVELYLLSLWLLFLLIILITVDVPMCHGENCRFIGVRELASRNVVPLIAVGFICLGAYAYWRFDFSVRGSTSLPSKVSAIQNEDYEHLTFLSTYIIPLICFDLESVRYTLALGILLVVIGVIYVRTDKYYANPTLAVLGYRLFRADLETRMGPQKNCVLIVRTDVAVDDSVRTLKLGQGVYYARRV